MGVSCLINPRGPASSIPLGWPEPVDFGPRALLPGRFHELVGKGLLSVDGTLHQAVFGFYGLEILIIYIALQRSYRDGLVYEKVRLTDESLTVEKGDLRGHRESWRFQPYWVRVSMDDPPHHESQVVLSSHGQSLIVGAFLSPEERLDFAKALRAALDIQRRPHGLFPIAEPS